MVAAHHSDLVAAKGCGLRTAFVWRRREFGQFFRSARTLQWRWRIDWEFQRQFQFFQIQNPKAGLWRLRVTRLATGAPTDTATTTVTVQKRR